MHFVRPLRPASLAVLPRRADLGIPLRDVLSPELPLLREQRGKESACSICVDAHSLAGGRRKASSLNSCRYETPLPTGRSAGARPLPGRLAWAYFFGVPLT